jgi:hypothetical protein
LYNFYFWMFSREVLKAALSQPSYHTYDNMINYVSWLAIKKLQLLKVMVWMTVWLIMMSFNMFNTVPRLFFFKNVPRLSITEGACSLCYGLFFLYRETLRYQAHILNHKNKNIFGAATIMEFLESLLGLE